MTPDHLSGASDMSSTPTTIEEVVHSPSRSKARGYSVGDPNRIVAWTGMACGAALGLIMGLWSFDGPVAPPNFIGDYTDTPRRLLRLGHIACFGIGILNLLLVQALLNAKDSPRVASYAAQAMNFGNIFLPLVLVIAAVYAPAKYLLPFPALSVFAALCLAAYVVAAGRQRC